MAAKSLSGIRIIRTVTGMNVLPGLIDSHFHLSEIEKREVPAVDVCSSLVEHAFAGGLNISLEYSDLVEKQSLLAHFPMLRTGYGLGPWAAQGDEPIDHLLSRLEKELSEYPADGIGEAGLDYYWNYGSAERQTELFEGQIRLASQLSRPIIIHSRDADEDMKAILKNTAFPASGIIHCFSADRDFARTALDAGLHISFAGPVTYKKNSELREVAAFVPSDRILVETDAPYLAPQAMRGKTNLPLYVSYVVQEIARVRAVGQEQLIGQIADNFNSLFP